MRILITGNMGYVGSELATLLRRELNNLYLIGYDSGFFSHCLTACRTLPEINFDEQYFGDMRKLPDSLLKRVDGVVHLAAISNDPMGNKFEEVTDAINCVSSTNLAARSVENDVKRFIFASSCSMYGSTENGARKEGDPLNPLTAYARSKVETEKIIKSIDLRKTIFTSLRFSTACGMSSRLRLDLVLNDFVACAVASREISVLSDGTPWRPLIDIKDMARAITWALIREPIAGGQYLAVNVGINEQNYQIKEIAEAVAEAVPGTKIQVNEKSPSDKRSYKVDFSLYNDLAKGYEPKVKLEQSINELLDGLKSMSFYDKDFRSSQLMRLKVLEDHIKAGRLSEDLYWSR